MGKIVVIKGSSRKDSNSNAMADAFIEKAKELGHSIVEVNASRMTLNGCHGCDTCFKTGKACSFDDDFNTIADDLLEADGWVFSFPIYWYSMPGMTKCILDNIYSFVIGQKDTKGKKLSVFSCAAEPDEEVFEHAVGAFEKSAALMGWDMVGNVIVGGVSENGAIRNTDGLERAAKIAELF